MGRLEKRAMEKFIKTIKKNVPEEDQAEVFAAVRSLDIGTIMSNPSILKDLKKDPSRLIEYANESAKAEGEVLPVASEAELVQE